VDIDVNGEAVLPAAGAMGVGVVRNKPVEGQSATIVSDGIMMAHVGTGGITAGDLVTVDADGHFVTAAAGNAIWGRALKTNAVDEVGTVLFSALGAGAAAA
jgi:hypothetical protein